MSTLIFLLDPKKIEMLLLPNFQLMAIMTFILKIQDLTQQTHWRPEGTFPKSHPSLSVAEVHPK